MIRNVGADILSRCAGHLPVATLADLPDPKAHLTGAHRSGRGRGLLIVCCKRLKSTRTGKIFDILWKKNIHKGECCATCSTSPFWDQVQLCIIECWKSSNNVILSQVPPEKVLLQAE